MMSSEKKAVEDCVGPGWLDKEFGVILKQWKTSGGIKSQGKHFNGLCL